MRSLPHSIGANGIVVCKLICSSEGSWAMAIPTGFTECDGSKFETMTNPCKKSTSFPTLDDLRDSMLLPILEGLKARFEGK